MAAHLKLVPKIDEQELMFVNVVDKKMKLGVLCRSLDFKFTTSFVGKLNGYKQFMLAYPVNCDIFSLKEKIQSIKDKESLLATIMLQGEILGISFKVLELTSEGILCEYPENIYQINRRSSRRHKIEPQKVSSTYLEIFVARISPVPIILPLNDISIHGLSFKVPMFLKTFFEKGQVFPKAQVVFNGKRMTLSCEVRNMLANAETKYPFRVGVKFLDITPMQQTEIQRFITSKPA